MANIVDKAKERDAEYKASDVRHEVHNPYHGIERVDMDNRRVAGSDALFGSYDYFGANHNTTDTNPSVGPFWRMKQLDSLTEFLEDVRDQRVKAISKHNKNTEGVEQFVSYMKDFDKLSRLIDIYMNKVKG